MPQQQRCVVATYMPNSEETMQMVVPVINTYPDALNEAKAVALDGIRQMVDAAKTLERES